MSTLSDNLKYYRQCSGMTSREVSEVLRSYRLHAPAAGPVRRIR